MANPVLVFLYLLYIHWFADFVLQTRWQAENKSKNNVALLAHVAVYTICLGFCFMPMAFQLDHINALPFFILWNGGLHFMTDWITSRASARMWKQERVHDFFVVIGLDQFIHQITLGLTLLYFFF